MPPDLSPSSAPASTTFDGLAPDTCPAGGSMQKVVVIDDCEKVRKLIKARLKEERVELHFAEGGMAGLALVRQLVPDLVLLDVDMPDLNGLEVIRQLKADPVTHHVPVIFLTGESTSEAKVQGFDLGAVDYVTKPFEPAELRARVRASLRTKYLLDLLSQRAMLDGLTGLWNRAYFNERLEQMVRLSRRYAASAGTGEGPGDAAGADRGPGGMSLILFDIDHFKRLNDTHGHPFGDEVLRMVARAAVARCRGSDVVCRYGGEEFAVLCPETDAAGAYQLAEDLRAGVHELGLKRSGQAVPVTASFGVTVHDGQSQADDLLSRADGALYDAKHAGRDRVVVAADLMPRPAAA